MVGSETEARVGRVLIVHPWVVQQRGGERTFYEIARAFPSADLALLFYRSTPLPADIASRIVRTSFLQARVFSRVPYRALAPLLPFAAEMLDARGYDTVLSSSSGWSHGVHAPNARHLCYMYTPPRYLWSRQRAPIEIPRMGRVFYRPLRSMLLRWDLRAAGRVDAFAAISNLVRRRIWAHYGKYATVICPPVRVDRMRLDTTSERSYALIVGELVPYKRFDIAIESAKRANVPLVVVGDGPERVRLEALSNGARVTFTGRISEARLVDLMAMARVFVYPALEDFGIVTVEALASGTPVVGLRRGGTGMIVREGMGELVESAEPEEFTRALQRAWVTSYDRVQMRRWAERFAPERFAAQLRSWVDACLAGGPHSQGRVVRDSAKRSGLARYDDPFAAEV